jgi:hypothetical protein
MVSYTLMSCPKERKRKGSFIQAVDEVEKEKTMSYLDKKHIDHIMHI